MKKLSVFLVAIAFATSCANSDTDGNRYSNPNSLKVDVYADAPAVVVDAGATSALSMESRTSIDTSGAGSWVTEWSPYDQLAGWSQEGGVVSRFTQLKYAADKSTFTGDVFGGNYRLIYPYSAVGEIEGGKCTLDISSQAGDLSTLPMINSVVIDKTKSDAVYMQHMTAATTFTLDLSSVESGMRLKSITLTGVPQTKMTIDVTKRIEDADFVVDEPMVADAAVVEVNTITLTPKTPKAVRDGEVSFSVGFLPGTSIAKGSQIKAVLSMQDEAGTALTPLTSTITVAEDLLFARNEVAAGGFESSFDLSSLEKVPATTTISALVKKVDAGSGESAVINDKEVVFYGVITSSTIGNNVLNKLVMLQEADDTGLLSTEANSGLVMDASTNTALKAIANKLDGTNGETFGLLVRVTIPAKADSSDATISAPSSVSYRTISYAEDNTTCITPLMVVDMSDKAIDLTDKTTDFAQYDAMFATVKSATVTSSGAYDYDDMCYIPAQTAASKTFNMFIKKQLTHWSGLEWVSGNSGDVVGTILSYSSGNYILPRTMDDMAAFEAAKILPTTSINSLIAAYDSASSDVSINDSEAILYGVVTSSLDNMSSSVMLQSADESAVVSTTAKSGVILEGLTKDQLETLVKKISGNTDSFGTYVRITIPAKTGSEDAATLYKNSDGNYAIKYKADNSSIVEPLRVVGMEATNVAPSVANLADYNGGASIYGCRGK